jgi:hypothetical protein
VYDSIVERVREFSMARFLIIHCTSASWGWELHGTSSEDCLMFRTKLFEINEKSAEVTKPRDSQFYLCCGLKGLALHKVSI